jgi:hypothetical protein
LVGSNPSTSEKRHIVPQRFSRFRQNRLVLGIFNPIPHRSKPFIRRRSGPSFRHRLDRVIFLRRNHRQQSNTSLTIFSPFCPIGSLLPSRSTHR